MLPFINSVRKRVCYDVMMEAIEENNISKLETALMFGNPNYVKGNALLDHFCEVPYKKTPLMLACYQGKFDMVKLLIEKGADVNYTKINAALSPLVWAIQGQSEQDLEIVKYLIEKGADVNFDNYGSVRPAVSWLLFSKTISENGLEILKCLIDAGADAQKMNYLQNVCYWKHDDIIKYFVEERNFSVQGGYIIQQYCSGVNDFSTEIFELLIHNGADIYATDEYNKSAVDYLLETTEGDTYWLNVIKSLYEEKRKTGDGLR